MPQPNNNPTDDGELREALESIANTVETEDGEYLAVDVDAVMQLILADRAKHEREARISELSALMTHRHYGKDYRESLDALDDYKDNRLAELRKDTNNG